MYPIIRKPWQLPERALTDERAYLGRREFLKQAGFAAGGVAGMMALLGPSRGPAQPAGSGGGGGMHAALRHDADGLFPAARNAAWKLDRDVSDEVVAATYNNFYEFTTEKENVWRLAQQFTQRPWEVSIAGECDRAGQTLDLATIARLAPMEERHYRHRCVEAWAMAVPWTGYPLAKFIAHCGPRPAAKYVRFVTFLRPDEAPGQAEQHWYPWPYYEALRLDEATNEVAMLVFGMYGHPLPMQHGAPLRVVTPWKYGYKSIKSFVEVEFTSERPKTFWNDIAPKEYSFFSNVDPTVPHPRWSQAHETMIGTEERRETQPYNGYGEWVATMYG